MSDLAGSLEDRFSRVAAQIVVDIKVSNCKESNVRDHTG